MQEGNSLFRNILSKFVSKYITQNIIDLYTKPCSIVSTSNEGSLRMKIKEIETPATYLLFKQETILVQFTYFFKDNKLWMDPNMLIQCCQL